MGSLRRNFSGTGSEIYPFHVGEFCGNTVPSFEKSDDDWDDQHHPKNLLEQLSDKTIPRKGTRYGEPHTYPGGTPLEELKKQGYVGIYLTEESTTTTPGEQFVPTPPELMEPGKEHLYNLDGKFGLDVREFDEPIMTGSDQTS